MKRWLLILLLIASSSMVLFAQKQEGDFQQKLMSVTVYADRHTLSDNLQTSKRIEKQFRKGHYKAVLKDAPTYLHSKMDLVNQLYFHLSEADRAYMNIMTEDDLIFHYILSAIVHSQNTEVLDDVYDYMLFIKHLQLRTEQDIALTISQSNNTQLQGLLEINQYLKQQLAISNATPSSRRDSMLLLSNRTSRILASQAAKLATLQKVSWRDIQRRLGNGEAAVEFLRFNIFKEDKITSYHLYAALVATQTTPTPVLILMTNERALTYWETNNLSGLNDIVKYADLYDADKYGAALSQLVWLNLAAYLDEHDISTVYFSPFGILNNLAIEHLPYDKESLMSEHYNLTRLTSTRELLRTHNHHPQPTVALYGNLSYRITPTTKSWKPNNTRSAVSPLPYSQDELNGITRILKDSNYLYLTFTLNKGTESSLRLFSGASPSILHFATHGFVNHGTNPNPMQRCGLIMTAGARAWEGKPVPPDQDDGILTAAEIAAMDLSTTDIVVLSACNTALGEITTEGVWGLQRAFKQAGVQTIVMSLWQVDDEATALLMQYFYEELLHSRSTLAKAVAIDDDLAEHIFDYSHEALYRAQRRLRSIPRYSSPYYWAGFIVVD